jgi:hypothetical protein
MVIASRFTICNDMQIVVSRLNFNCIGWQLGREQHGFSVE